MSTEILEQTVENENEMKEWLVSYVGEKHHPEDGNVTVSMIVEQMAEDFPEFVLAVAEENWVRGYEQGVTDTHQLSEDTVEEVSDDE